MQMGELLLDWPRDQLEVQEMGFPFGKTVESPCRECENIHLNKEECGRNCEKLKAFQDAILRHDERNIKAFRLKNAAPRT